jgi:murein DD-endopeptidase MepM/ murein hydrolase activator NlpD
MAATRSPARYHDLRTFAAGAGCGFFAGAVVVWLAVWQFGVPITWSNITGIRAPERSSARGGNPPTDDGGSGVLESDEEIAATSGRTRSATSSPSASSSIGPPPNSPSELADRDLQIPVEGVRPDQLTRQFSDVRGFSRRHEALDIMAPRNTPVRAVEDGRIVRLFLSKPGGNTIYQFDPSERYCYYYAHLERYADGLREGDIVKKGQVIGYVGTSGNAPKDAPHLHFAVFRLTAEKRWWEGTPIDPYDILR